MCYFKSTSLIMVSLLSILLGSSIYSMDSHTPTSGPYKKPNCTERRFFIEHALSKAGLDLNQFTNLDKLVQDTEGYSVERLEQTIFHFTKVALLALKNEESQSFESPVSQWIETSSNGYLPI